VGWYLMLPPVQGAPAQILDHAPLSEWDIASQYDTKAECEKAIPSHKDIQESVNQCSNGGCATNRARPGYGRCIAADDPRLKGKKSGKAAN
jgi:hypothetical protein